VYHRNIKIPHWVNYWIFFQFYQMWAICVKNLRAYKFTLIIPWTWKWPSWGWTTVATGWCSHRLPALIWFSRVYHIISIKIWYYYLTNNFRFSHLYKNIECTYIGVILIVYYISKISKVIYYFSLSKNSSPVGKVWVILVKCVWKLYIVVNAISVQFRIICRHVRIRWIVFNRCRRFLIPRFILK